MMVARQCPRVPRLRHPNHTTLSHLLQHSHSCTKCQPWDTGTQRGSLGAPDPSTPPPPPAPESTHGAPSVPMSPAPDVTVWDVSNFSLVDRQLIHVGRDEEVRTPLRYGVHRVLGIWSLTPSLHPQTSSRNRNRTGSSESSSPHPVGGRRDTGEPMTRGICMHWCKLQCSSWGTPHHAVRFASHHAPHRALHCAPLHAQTPPCSAPCPAPPRRAPRPVPRTLRSVPQRHAPRPVPCAVHHASSRPTRASRAVDLALHVVPHTPVWRKPPVRGPPCAVTASSLCADPPDKGFLAIMGPRRWLLCVAHGETPSPA